MMKPKNDEALSAVSVLVVVTAYLFLASMVMSFLLLNAFGESGQTIKLPSQKDVITYSNTQFENGSVDISTLEKAVNSVWRFDSDGATLVELSNHGWSPLVIDNVQPNDAGYYVNSYWINNSHTDILGQTADYCILLRATGGVDTNEICVDGSGFVIPNYLIDANTHWGESFRYNYPNAKDVTNPTIKTVYYDGDGTDSNMPTVEFYFNDVKMFETSRLHKDANLFGLWGRYYAGVNAYEVGLNLQKFQTEGSIVKGSNDSTGGNILSMLYSLFATMLKIATWSVPSEFFAR